MKIWEILGSVVLLSKFGKKNSKYLNVFKISRTILKFHIAFNILEIL